MSRFPSEEVDALRELVGSQGWRILLRELEALNSADLVKLDRVEPQDAVEVARLQMRRKVRREVASLPEEWLRRIELR